MSLFSKKKLIIYGLVIAMAASTLAGCNKDDAENPDAAENTEAPADDGAEQALADAVEQALADQPEENDAPAEPDTAGNPDAAPDDQVGTPSPTALGERSPVEITRIEVEEPPQATGAGEINDGSSSDEHEHEPAPNLFRVSECQVEIQGLYKVKLAKDLLKEINSRRKDYGIGQLKESTSLLACADTRCKEQTYFVGHFRPDGSSFDSVSPEGYVQGECIAVEYRTVKDIMEAWFAVNKSRMQIMNPDYTQCGISIYDIDGQYFIAAEFAY